MSISLSDVLIAIQSMTPEELLSPKTRNDITSLKVAIDSIIQSYELSTAAPAPKKIKKSKKITESNLLIPIDESDSSIEHTFAYDVGHNDKDIYCKNQYRLQNINASLCMGRKIDEKNPVPGTRPGDNGAKGKFFPEMQCTKKPVPGTKLCKICAEKDIETKADATKFIKGWYGRLDEPMYDRAYVLGCKHFFMKYPKGLETVPVQIPDCHIESDRETIVPESESIVTSPIPVILKKSKKEKTKKIVESEPLASEPLVSETVESEQVISEEASAAPKKSKTKSTIPKKSKKSSESVAVTQDAPKPVEWVTFFYEGMPLIRNTVTNNCYQVNMTESNLEDMVQKDKYEGRWIPTESRLEGCIDEDQES